MPLDRRQFLQAAAATAAPLVAPSILFARSRVRPADRITLGFIGVGVMNRDHIKRFLKNDAVQVLAVCDVDTTRREDAKKLVDAAYKPSQGSRGCAAYVDYIELLARPDIDAVCIATPDHWHANVVIDAAKAGKDIYCEKPLSLTLGEARSMVEAVRKYGRVCQTGSQQRSEYNGQFRRACELVRSGKIGDVLTVHVGVGASSRWCDLPEEPMEPGLEWDRWLGPAPKRPYNSVLSPRGVHTHYPRWRDYREYSGGEMTDFGAHHFDIAQWGLGMDESGPVEVHPPEKEGAEYGARLVYDNGVSVVHGGPSGITFIGTKGTVYVDRGVLTSTPDSIVKEAPGEGGVRLPEARSHHANWLECIRSRQRPICDVEVGARSVAVCHLANLAYWHRRPLRWDPRAWRFMNDEEANTWLDYQRREGYELPAV